LKQQREVTVHVPFRCDLEIRDREQFQAEGHYVISTIRGPVVYALTHAVGMGEPKLQIARTQGGTETEAVRAMQEALATTLWGLAKQDAIQAEIQKQYRVLNAERNRLTLFLDEHYRPDELLYQEPGIEAVMRLLLQERKRWWGRFVRWLKRKSDAPAAPNPPASA